MKALTYKEKQEALEDIFKYYHRAILQLRFYEERNYYPSIQWNSIRESKTYYYDKGHQWNEMMSDKEELEKIIESFNFILSCLSEESRNMIEKEFIHKEGKYWWLEYYSRSTYYRVKTRAMEEALYYFNCLEKS